ncbi:MAG: M3 family metallopeptidase [Planctomycetota bacterium]
MTTTSTEAPFLDRVRESIRAAREHLEEFLALPHGTPASVAVPAFDRIGAQLDEVSGPAQVYSSAHPDTATRDVAELALQELAAFGTELSLHKGAYEALAAIDMTGATPDEQRFVEQGLRDYRRGGVDKDDRSRERIRELQRLLVEVGQRFDRNIVEGNRTVRLEGGHAELAGLPSDFLAAHPEDADGSVTLATEPTVFLPVMLYAERDDVRQRLLFEYQNRAYPTNMAVLDELLEKRYELATLLGAPHWADWLTEDRMARSAAEARGFVERVVALARPQAEREYAQLLAEKRRSAPDATRVEPHESRFLTERVKRTQYSFDSQSVRPYFAYDRVERGVLETTAALYGVTIARNTEVEVWHADVRAFDVSDASGVIARFYLDMFPREGKFKHAAMFDWRRGTVDGPLPEAALLCNFPRPTADDPALLLHDQVTTYFHEFGHLMHHLFARQRRFAFAGISCEWDFVEVPSQLYEEWAWDVRVLQSFARHWQTDEPISAELVERLRAAEEFPKGLNVTAQMVYATYSLDLYDRDPRGLDTTRALEDVQRRVSLFERVPGTHMQASFGHLHGYSAGYYTYMWSLVISKDFWGAFAREPMDRATADRYRREVLSMGGARDAGDMVRSFLGREYGFEAFEAWLRA